MKDVVMVALTAVVVCSLRYLLIRMNRRLRRYFSDGPYGDASTYFFLVQFFRNNSCGVPDNRCLLSNEPVLVPSLFMKIVGFFFPDKVLFRASWVPNVVLYAVSALVFVIFVSRSGFVSGTDILLVAGLFMIQPDNISLDRHRIQYSVLQPRFLGLLVNSFFWLLYISYGMTLPVFVIGSALVFLSLNISIFCRQASVFIIVTAALFNRDPFLFLALVAGALVSALAFPKEFLPSIKPQIRYSYQYFLNYYKPSFSGNRLMRLIKGNLSRPLMDSYPYFLSGVTLVIAGYMMVSNPALTGADDGLLSRLVMVYSAVLVVFIITGVRKFAFLGECWRYFSYSTYFSTPLFVVVLVNSTHPPAIVKYAAMAGIAVIYILMAILGAKDMFENKNASLMEALDKAEGGLKEAVWFGVPYRVSTFAVSLGYGAKTFEYQYGNHSKEIHDEYFAQYPFLKWDKDLLQRHGVTHILVEEELEAQARDISGFSTEGLTRIAGNSQYTIYRYPFSVN